MKWGRWKRMIKRKKKKLRVSNVFAREMLMFSQWWLWRILSNGIIVHGRQRSSFLRNVTKCFPYYTVSHVGRQISAMYLHRLCHEMPSRWSIMPVSTLMTYGIIFWGNSTCNDIFRLQKRITRIIMGVRTRDSCGEVFRVVKLLPLTSQYIFSLALCVVNK